MMTDDLLPEWKIAIELDGMLSPDQAAKRIADQGWSDVVQIKPLHATSPRLGQWSNLRSTTTMRVEALIAAPDLDEAVWRLKAILRSLQILRPEPSFLSMSASRVRGPE